MNAQEFLVEMKAVLADERDALRRLDARAVMSAGERKEEIFRKLVNASESEKRGLAPALLEVKVELRRNLVLLAHARDYLRDAITLCTQNKQAARPRLQASL